MGLRSRPTYRLVVIDSRKARDGKYIESVGNYNPRSKLLNLDQDRVRHWVGKGARLSDTVDRLVRRHARQHQAAEPVVPAEPETAEPAAPSPETATEG
jgi:small subunit ribosomal protein S16